MNWKNQPWLFCAAVFLGVSGGFLTHSVALRFNGERATTKAFRSMIREDTEKTKTARTFGGLVELSKNDGAVPEKVRSAIKEADSRQLRQMMKELALLLKEDPQSRSLKEVLDIAASELFRRGEAEALEWAEASGFKEIEKAVIVAITREKPIGAKIHHERYLAKYGDPHVHFGLDAVVAAAMRDAEDLLVAEKEYYNCGVGSFAEDFDFLSYVSKSGSEMNIAAAFGTWIVRDPEAAGKALREDLGIVPDRRDERFVRAFVGRAAVVGEMDGAKWISDQLRALPEDHRIKAAGSLASSYPTNTRIRALLEHLSSEAEKIEFAALVLSGMNPPTKEWIASNMTELTRIRIVEKRLALGISVDWEKKELISLLESFGGDLKLPQAEVERLRKMIEQKEQAK